MPLSPEQIKELKKQLSAQILHLPEEKRKEAQKQIDSMSIEAVENMLKQQLQQQPKQKTQQLIFRTIVSGEIPSKKIDENKDAIAVLDIKPISKGHTIIIPKRQITNANKLTPAIFSLAKKIAKKLFSKLKSKGCEIQTEFKFDEIIINVIPIYDKSLNINSPRQEIPEKELNEIYNKLKKEKSSTIKIKTKARSSIIKLKRKIP